MLISSLNKTPSKVIREGVEVADAAAELPDPDARVAEREAELAEPVADSDTWTLLVLDMEALVLELL